MPTHNGDFIKLVQQRQSNISIGPSTARRMGPAGTIAVARDFLQYLDLNQFANVNTASAFGFMLNSLTNDFKTALPKGGRHWGSARKFLNIFLRDVLYNQYLCEGYNFLRLEPWLEVPLDRHVAKALHLEEGSDELPKWRTIVGLKSVVSNRYQEFADKVAASKGIYRVHLDLYYWRLQQAK